MYVKISSKKKFKLSILSSVFFFYLKYEIKRFWIISLIEAFSDESVNNYTVMHNTVGNYKKFKSLYIKN